MWLVSERADVLARKVEADRIAAEGAAEGRRPAGDGRPWSCQQGVLAGRPRLPAGAGERRGWAIAESADLRAPTPDQGMRDLDLVGSAGGHPPGIRALRPASRANPIDFPEPDDQEYEEGVSRGRDSMKPTTIRRPSRRGSVPHEYPRTRCIGCTRSLVFPCTTSRRPRVVRRWALEVAREGWTMNSGGCCAIAYVPATRSIRKDEAASLPR